MIFYFKNLYSDFLISKTQFSEFKNNNKYVDCHINTTWHKLHNPQLPRGQKHATSAVLWG